MTEAWLKEAKREGSNGGKLLADAKALLAKYGRLMPQRVSAGSGCPGISS